MRRIHPFAFVVVLLVTFFAGGIIISTMMLEQPLLAQSETSQLSSDESESTPQVAQDSSADMQPSSSQPFFGPYAVADIAEAATPGVVLIHVEWPAPERMPRQSDPFGFFWDFFGSPFPFEPSPRGPAVSSGSGFLFDEEGHIFTNQHVVGDPGEGQTITVRLHPSSGIDKELEAEIIGSDYELDLAILKLKDVPEEFEGKLSYLRMGDSDASRPGEWVVAIGNPYGYEHTVTFGSLSAKGREITIFDRERNKQKVYRDLLQTDAAINQGNSGGPLINIQGEVIGINTAVQANGQGIGFAIPINSALAVRDELIETGKVSRETPALERFVWEKEVISVVLGQDPSQPGKPLLGIEMTDVTDYHIDILELPEDTKGAYIAGVVRGSAAHDAGIRPNDIVVNFGDAEIESADALVDAVANMRPGQKVIVTVLRHKTTTSQRST